MVISLIVCSFIIKLHFRWKKPKTKYIGNNCSIKDLKSKIINMARKTIKNQHCRLNMQITELSANH